MLRSGRSSACSLRSSWASPLADGGRAVRSINLLKLALEAELLRLRAMTARQGRRAVFAVVALIFALVVLALAEAAGWLALRHRFPSIPATLILLGINLVIAASSACWRRDPRRGTRSRRRFGYASRLLKRHEAVWPSPRPFLQLHMCSGDGAGQRGALGFPSCGSGKLAPLSWVCSASPGCQDQLRNARGLHRVPASWFGGCIGGSHRDDIGCPAIRSVSSASSHDLASHHHRAGSVLTSTSEND